MGMVCRLRKGRISQSKHDFRIQAGYYVDTGEKRTYYNINFNDFSYFSFAIRFFNWNFCAIHNSFYVFSRYITSLRQLDCRAFRLKEMSLFWKWIQNKFCNEIDKRHVALSYFVLNVIHLLLKSLPWGGFWYTVDKKT